MTASLSAVASERAASTTFPTVILVRHAHTALNSGGADRSPDRIRGWQDIPLDAEGHREAERTAQRVKRLVGTREVLRLYTSDLQRAVSTANCVHTAIPGSPKPIPTRDLRPWRLGDKSKGGWEGELSSVVYPRILDLAEHHPEQAAPGGGESFHTFLSRLTGCMDGIFTQAARDADAVVIAITSYRDVKAILAKLAAGWKGSAFDHEEFARDNVPTGAVIPLTYRGGAWSGRIIGTPGAGARRQALGVGPGKATKAAAHYREASRPRVNCGECEYMVRDGSCRKVLGMVDRQHVCDLFEREDG